MIFVDSVTITLILYVDRLLIKFPSQCDITRLLLNDRNLLPTAQHILRPSQTDVLRALNIMAGDLVLSACGNSIAALLDLSLPQFLSI
jgi:hypothetical protein